VYARKLAPRRRKLTDTEREFADFI
jgi:hypothetical protein